jgi:hypothetical protein
MSKAKFKEPETDPRFPSGAWVGFFLQKEIPGRHWMDLRLQFSGGQLEGEGRDWVGPFTLCGRYELSDGQCHWTKRYQGKHDVFYKGYNEGKGIWGVWEFPEPMHQVCQRGGFHIWPEGMPEPTGAHLTEEAVIPWMVEDSLEISHPVGVP